MICISALNIYPVKSCAGVARESAVLTTAGLELDRNWMIVDRVGRCVTQRQRPMLARVSVGISDHHLHLSAPAMPELLLSRDAPGRAIGVEIWGEQFDAIDAGSQPAEWVSEFLGAPHRLVRFDPAVSRPSDRGWTGDDEALNRFSDGFPLLLVARASLDDLNRRLAEPVPMNRFRPNVVMDGLGPYEEDYVDTLACAGITLRAVKPCTRCEIVTTDQSSGLRGPEPLRTLTLYRANARVNGGITFGQNVIVTGGAGERLGVGMTFDVRWSF